MASSVGVARVVPGPDGHRVRVRGAYAGGRVCFLDDYLPAALRAAARKPRRVYVDLFAGPGLECDRASGRCYAAAALRALRLGARPAGGVAFDQAVLVNADADDHAALVARVDRLAAEGRLAVPRTRITLLHAAAHAVVHQLDRIVPRSAYAFAFVDPPSTGAWPWAMVEALTRHAPVHTELCAVVPDVVVGEHRRLDDRDAAALTRFFGTERWRECWDRTVARAAAGGQRPALRRALAALYRAQLGTLWRHVRCPRRTYGPADTRMSSPVFASNWRVALQIRRGEVDGASTAPPARHPALFGFRAGETRSPPPAPTRP